MRFALDHEGVAAGMASANRKPETLEVGFNFADGLPAVDHLPALRPLTHRVIGQRDAEDPHFPGCRYDWDNADE